MQMLQVDMELRIDWSPLKAIEYNNSLFIQKIHDP